MRLRDNPFLQALLVIAALYIAWHIHFILILIYVAFLLTTVLRPAVIWLKEHRLPTPLAVIVPIALVFCLACGLLYLLLPPFIQKITDFSAQVPALLQSVAHQFHRSLDTTQIYNYINGHISRISHYAFIVTGTAVKLLAAAISVLVLAIYWLSSYDQVKTGLLGVVLDTSRRRRLDDIWLRIERKLQLWFKAHLMLNTAVGVMVLVAMNLLHVPFASLLALLAFTVEIIPTAGPLIAGAPAVVLALTDSILRAVVVIIVYTIIQMIESHILSPILLGKTVRLHPLWIIISLLIGAEIFGIIGALLAVPTALCISAVVDSYRHEPRPKDKMRRVVDGRS